MRPDLWKHFWYSVVLTLVASFGLQDATSGALVALLVGVAREIAQFVTSVSWSAWRWAYQWRATRWALIGHAEMADIGADLLGVLVGSAVSVVALNLAGAFREVLVR